MIEAQPRHHRLRYKVVGAAITERVSRTLGVRMRAVQGGAGEAAAQSPARSATALRNLSACDAHAVNASRRGRDQAGTIAREGAGR